MIVKLETTPILATGPFGLEKNMTALGACAVDIPRHTELLQGLEPSEVDVVLGAAKPRQFSAKSVITHQNDPAERFFLMWKGRARYFFESIDGKKRILIHITPGHIFGAAPWDSPPLAILSAQKRCGTALCSFGMARLFAS